MSIRDAGILLLDKPAGMSSAQALNSLKRRLDCGKIGHAGTLDPDATGLLVCLTGAATRLAHYAEVGSKIYSGVIQLGVRTNTDDISGHVLSSCSSYPDFAAVEASAARFVGTISQVPPQVSAIKVNGERGYVKARRGEQMQLAPRSVTVEQFTVSPLDESRIGFEISCSKGTYIRALARDLGDMMGCGACLYSLRRNASYPFHVDQAKTIEEIEAADTIAWENLFPGASRVEVSGQLSRRLMSGDERALAEVVLSLDGDKALYGISTETGLKPLGLLVRNGGMWRFGVNLS